MAKQRDSKLGGSKKLKPPKKPYVTFPLTPHASGKWQKKINCKIFYFGRWARLVNKRWERVAGDGWREALAEYREKAPDLHAGRTPVPLGAASATMMDICNKFLNSKWRKRKNGELTARTFWDYKQTTNRLIEVFGKRQLAVNLRPADFIKLRNSIAATCSSIRLKNEITRVKSVFKYAVDNDLIDGPVRMGSEFTPPDSRVIKRQRDSTPASIFTANEILLMLAALRGEEVEIHSGARHGKKTVQLRPDTQLLGSTLLGINAGCGNTDVANLQMRHLDLKGRWLNYPRIKTSVNRRIPLWPETCQALQEAMASRPKPKDKADVNCVFLTPRGTRLVRLGENSRTDYLCRKFGDLLERLGIGADGRCRLNFYALRHTLTTHALELADRDAVKAILGHSHTDMTARYDHAPPDDKRLEKVVEHVRKWLFHSDSAA